MKISGVYQITFSCSETRYIGSSSDMLFRRDCHLYDLRCRVHVNSHLQNAFNKYGEGAFRFRVLLYCDPYNCTLYEQRLIDFLGLEKLYNICPQVNSVARTRVRPYHLSFDHREKISRANRGKTRTQKMRERNSLTHRGKYPSQETREKLRQAQRARRLREKMNDC